MADDIDRDLEQVDAIFHVGSLLARGLLYAFVYAIADRFDCGRAVLAGLLLGDVVGNLASIWAWRQVWPDLLAQLALQGICWLCLHDRLGWPEEPPLRAILGLTAFGVFASRVGSSLLTQSGPRSRDYA